MSEIPTLQHRKLGRNPKNQLAILTRISDCSFLIPFACHRFGVTGWYSNNLRPSGVFQDKLGGQRWQQRQLQSDREFRLGKTSSRQHSSVPGVRHPRIRGTASLGRLVWPGLRLLGWLAWRWYGSAKRQSAQQQRLLRLSHETLRGWTVWSKQGSSSWHQIEEKLATRCPCWRTRKDPVYRHHNGLLQLVFHSRLHNRHCCCGYLCVLRASPVLCEGKFCNLQQRRRKHLMRRGTIWKSSFANQAADDDPNFPLSERWNRPSVHILESQKCVQFSLSWHLQIWQQVHQNRVGRAVGVERDASGHCSGESTRIWTVGSASKLRWCFQRLRPANFNLVCCRERQGSSTSHSCWWSSKQ